CVIDCSGLHILPGIVDVHGDAFERELFPRPGVDIAAPVALASVDQQLAANGITTAYHGLTVSWEPGQRSLDAGIAFMTALDDARPSMTVDHRVQIRWETFAFDAVETVISWLAQEPRPALAFNDHTTLTIRKIADGRHEKLGQWADRAGMTPDEYVSACQRLMSRSADVSQTVKRVAAVGRAESVVMLSHDDGTVVDRDDYRSLGASVCEFPLSVDVARDASARGEPVVLGAPNVLRGGSHTGALTAADAIGSGYCSVLASDYYYPSLFHAAISLARADILSLQNAWALISANPAAAMQLDDRGALAPGKRADVVLADLRGKTPRIVATLSGGAIAYKRDY
ncbi:MAG: alpha-D-ribose 1-methylphosphonate 5-triphosphate diphosphatase, partial [Pseudomonadota bacterium]